MTMKFSHRIAACLCAASVCTVPFVAFAGSSDPSVTKSMVVAQETSAVADGQQKISVRVTVMNENGDPLSGKLVALAPSDPGSVVASSPVETDAFGTATFTVKTALSGTYTLVAMVGSAVLAQQPVVQFSVPNCAYTPGTLVKLPDDGNPETQIDSAVYYYGADCKRHAFPNEQVFNTWYANFNDVQVKMLEEMANMPLGQNVTYKPGVRLVKFASLPKVYAVSRGGVLRWVATEDVASSLYGADWSKKVDDIADTFYGNYSFGPEIGIASEYQPSNEQANAPKIDASF